MKPNALVLTALARDVHELAKVKGWWDGSAIYHAFANDEHVSTEIAAKLCLIHSEVSEALECVRDRDLEPRTVECPKGSPLPKPDGLPSELADIIIRVLDLSVALGIDVGAAVAEKHAFNQVCSHRHGGRAL